VNWDIKARCTIDGKYYTISGVSAGMDMALGLLSGQRGLILPQQWQKKLNIIGMIIKTMMLLKLINTSMFQNILASFS